MDPQVQRGRQLVVAVIVACIAVSLATITLTTLVTGPEGLGRDVVRFVLTVLLCILLYQGRNWVRWLLGILLILGGIGGLLGGVVLLTQTLLAIPLILLGLVYLGCAGVLFFAPSVRAFFAASRSGSPA